MSTCVGTARWEQKISQTAWILIHEFSVDWQCVGGEPMSCMSAWWQMVHRNYFAVSLPWNLCARWTTKWTHSHTTSTLTSGITRDDDVWDWCECESMIYGAFFRCPFICGNMQILYMQYKNGLHKCSKLVSWVWVEPKVALHWLFANSFPFAHDACIFM